LPCFLVLSWFSLLIMSAMLVVRSGGNCPSRYFQNRNHRIGWHRLHTAHMEDRERQIFITRRHR
jgi:hypothetical protein